MKPSVIYNTHSHDRFLRRSVRQSTIIIGLHRAAVQVMMEIIVIGDGGGGRGGGPKKEIRKHILDNYHVKFGRFSVKYHVKFGNFVKFSGKYYYFSNIYVRAKNVLAPES